MSKQLRTVWISDVHLGNPNCQHQRLYDFLKGLECDDGSYDLENLYLVGDIIDMTQFNHRVFWSEHRSIIKKLFRMADRGVNITYIRGNHDVFLEREFLRESPDGVNFNGIKIQYRDIYTAHDGKRYLVLHGDEFDGVIRMFPLLYRMGDLGYKLIIWINRLQNSVRRFLGIKEWSFAQWIKHHVKRSIQFTNNFEHLVAEVAEREGVNGVICGHIHHMADRDIRGVRYLNCGCWVEFCSHIQEDQNGQIRAVMNHE